MEKSEWKSTAMKKKLELSPVMDVIVHKIVSLFMLSLQGKATKQWLYWFATVFIHFFMAIDFPP